MTPMKTLAAASSMMILGMTGAALADGKAAVEAFYAFLSNPASVEHTEAFKAASTPQWESIGDYSGKTKPREEFVGQLGGFAQLIPDLNWEIAEVLQDGNRYIVRGRATGSPTGPLFGVDGQGRGFEIMSIDIHTVEDGKVVTTYHVEDWAGALRQLSGR